LIIISLQEGIPTNSHAYGVLSIKGLLPILPYLNLIIPIVMENLRRPDRMQGPRYMVYPVKIGPVSDRERVDKITLLLTIIIWLEVIKSFV
jgi:hypothetical protein